MLNSLCNSCCYIFQCTFVKMNAIQCARYFFNVFHALTSFEVKIDILIECGVGVSAVGHSSFSCSTITHTQQHTHSFPHAHALPHTHRHQEKPTCTYLNGPSSVGIWLCPDVGVCACVCSLVWSIRMYNLCLCDANCAPNWPRHPDPQRAD